MANLLINTTVGGNAVITTSNIGSYALTSITSGNVTTALGYTPYNATNPSGYISSITSGNVTTALGFTPYNATNPNAYITSSNNYYYVNPGNGYGLGFWGNSPTTYGITMANESAGYGVIYGLSEYHLYFSMTGGGNRGFVFRNDAHGAVTQIGAYGWQMWRGELYPGYNNATSGSQTSYYIYGNTNSGGIRTNGNWIVNGDIYLGTRDAWLSTWLNQDVKTSASPSFSTVNVNTLNSSDVNARYFSQSTNGVPSNNLGNPTVTEMALFDEQFNNKTAFYNPASLSFWTSSDGTNYTEYTAFDTTTKKRFLGGDSDSEVYIPNLTNRFRIEVENSAGYVFLNQLYIYWSSNSHSTKVHIWVRRCDNNQWYQWTDSNQYVSSWPGHLYLPFGGIPFYPGALASSGHYNRIRIEFIPSWSSGTYSYTNINLMRMQIWGGYPAGKRNIYSTDENQNVSFPATISATTFSGALSGNATTASALTSMNISQFTNNSGYLTSLPSHNHDDRYYTESESDSRYLILGGSWGADLTSNGWTRKVGYAADGGEWVLLSASGQISSLLDGSYFAGESGGFYSMTSSNTYASRRGFYNDGTYANFNTPLKASSYVVSTGAFMEGYGSYSSKLGRVAMISLDWNSNYDEPYNHGIMSTNSNGDFADSLSINSFNDITLRLDANNNNSESYVRIMNNTQGSNTIAYIGHDGGSPVAWFGGVVTAANDFRAPIFYDSANTNYYGDFASTSVMNAIRFGTSTNNGTLNGAGDWGMRLTTDAGYIQFGPANSSYAHIYTDRDYFYFNKALLINGSTVITAATIGSQTVAIAGALSSMNISQFTNNSGYITSSSLSAYLPLAGGSMTGDINMSSNTGIQYTSTHWIRPRDSSGNLHIKADSGGIYLDADVIHLRGVGGVNDTTVTGGNITTAGGYYTNAGLSTNGSNGALTVQSPGGASRGNASSTETGAFKIKLPAGLPVYGMFKLVIHIYEYGNRGNGYEIHCGGHMYPNYMYNRFQVQYGASNSPLTVRYGNDGSTGCIWIGNLDTTWSYPQIWVSEFMIGYSNTSWATWRSGWSITLDSASFGNSGAMDGPYTCEFGYAATANYAATSGSATTATTASNTNSISNALGNTHTWTGAQNNFLGNGNTASTNNVGLVVYSNGGSSVGAQMSFHRSGQYAINMGLDSDNVFRIGGWSAGANRLQLDMSGNLTIAGALAASNFSGTSSGTNTGDQTNISGNAATATALTSMNISQFTNNSGYITGISFANVSSKPTTINGYGITDAITTANIGSQSVNYATTAGSAPNGSNVNDFYNVTAGLGNGLKFWNSDNYKISMGASSLYYYGPVTDYSIKTQMNDSDAGRGFTWGRLSYAPIAALNATSGDMQIAGSLRAAGHLFTSYNGNNILLRSADNAGDAGILVQNSGGSFKLQLYGNGSDYGFLNGNWAGWDIRKTIGGVMYMNNNNSYYIQTDSTSNFYALNIQGSAVVHAGNIGSQSVSNSNYINSTRDTPGNALQYWQAPSLGIDEAPSSDWHNTIRMGHGSPLSYYSNTLAVRMTGSGVGDIYTQTIVNGTRQGWKKHWNDGNDGSGSGLDADLLDGQQGSYYQPASTAITTSNIGSQSVSYATTSGALTSMNISQFTNNSGYITGYTETDTLATVTGRGATTSTPITVTASEGREVAVYMASSYTTDDLVSGHEYGWYSDHWRLGMTRSGGAQGADFVIQWNGARRLSLTNGGNLTVTGTISATNFSGSSSGTNTGDQTNISGNAATATLASTVTINYNNDSNASYQLLWGSGNSVYGTANIYVNPSSDTIYATAYRGNANVAGTGEAIYAPAGVYSTGTNWLYGTMYVNGNSINDASYFGIIGTNTTPINITGASHKYITINPGNGYEAMVRYVGGSGSSWYVGKRVSSQVVGTESFHFYSEAALATVGGIDTSGNMHATGSFRAPIFYDSADTSYYVDPNDVSQLNITKSALRAHKNMTGYGVGNWISDFSNTPVSSMTFGQDKYDGGPSGTWWFQVNMRHNNGSNLWGTQLAYGWEDNSNEIYQRNVTGGSWSGWVRYINSSNYAGILDARYYTESEVNSLLSAKQDSSTAITTSNIGSQSVSYATTAGTANAVAWGNVSSKPSYIMYYQGFTLDANTMDANSTGFTYSVNAPFTGPIARLSEPGYSLQFNAAYSGGGTGIAFRTRNGDTASFNTWRVLLNDSNYTSYSPSLTGSGASGSWGISVTGSAGSVAWTNVSSRPTALSQFTNDLGNYGGFLTSITAHTHAISDVTGLQTALDGKQASGSYAASSHTHDDRYYTESESDTRFARKDTDAAISGNLVIGNGTYGNSTAYGSSGARLMFSGSDGDAQGNYYIGTNHNDYGGNYSKLELRWHTGIRMGAQPGYGGIRFYDTEDLGTVIFSVGTGDSHVRVVNNLYVGGNLALHAGNYNSYSPTLTGTGASGTWSISVSGNAATATNVAYSGLTGTVPTWNQNTTGSAGSVGGYAVSGSVGANTVVIRDGNGYIYAHYINSNVSETENPTINSFYTSNGDGWLRKSSVAHVKSQLGLGSMAYESSGTYQTVSGAINTGNIASQSVSYATISQQLTKFGDIYGQDWNSYFITGKLIVSNALGHTGANRPSDSYGYGTVLSYGETGGPLMQMYFPEDVANTGGAYRALAYRSGYNGSWSAWKTVVNQVGNTCTVAGSNGTGLQVHSNVGYNQNPLTYFLLRGQADSSWKTFKILLTGDAGGQDIEFRRIAENSTDARMFYVPRGLNQVIFDYTVVQPSDSRLKDNLTLITTPVDKIKSLRGVEFDWNSGEHVGTHDVGLIAQDVEAVLPEAVTTQEDGYKNLAYTKVIPLLVEAMKEQQTMIEALRAEIELLKNK
jgi:hypothetical protein